MPELLPLSLVLPGSPPFALFSCMLLNVSCLLPSAPPSRRRPGALGRLFGKEAVREHPAGYPAPGPTDAASVKRARAVPSRPFALTCGAVAGTMPGSSV